MSLVKDAQERTDFLLSHLRSVTSKTKEVVDAIKSRGSLEDTLAKGLRRVIAETTKNAQGISGVSSFIAETENVSFFLFFFFFFFHLFNPSFLLFFYSSTFKINTIHRISNKILFPPPFFFY
jgi:hypothetical protein